MYAQGLWRSSPRENSGLPHHWNEMSTVQGARKCMAALRIAAYEYLNFGDGSLPNCLRMPYHDAATYKNATKIGG